MLVAAEVDVEPEEPRYLIRRRIRDRYFAAEDNRCSSGIDSATLSRCLGFRAVQGHRCVRQPIAARELSDATHVAIGLLTYEVEAAAALVELRAAPGRKHGDDDVRHLGDLRHERKEGLARYFDNSRINYRAQRQGGGTAVQQADLPHELSWPKGRRVIALASERINYFNLALLDVHEAVHLFALLGHDRALGMRHYLPRRPQCLNMRAGEWCPYHLAQIFAYRLHPSSSGCITTHITTAGIVRYRCGRNGPARVDVIVRSIRLWPLGSRFACDAAGDGWLANHAQPGTRNSVAHPTQTGRRR